MFLSNSVDMMKNLRIVQWESNNDDGQPNLWFGFSNKFDAYLGPPEHIRDVGTGSHRILTMQFFQKENKKGIPSFKYLPCRNEGILKFLR